MLKVVLLLVAAVAAASAQNAHYPAGDGPWVWEPLHPTLGELTDQFKDVPETHIVGGSVIAEGSRPFQAALFIDNRYFCGGSLIAEDWVMTAGHCADHATEVIIALGAYNLSAPVEAGRQVYLSNQFIVHENFSLTDLNNDIALIKLPTKAAITASVQLVTLPAKDTDLGAGVNLTASGWGKISDDAVSITPVLREVSVPSISNGDCTKAYSADIILPSTLCTSGDNGMGTCNGDSGGPLTETPAGGNVTVRGIVSFGHVGGCQQGLPDGFTRVSHFVDWIASKTGAF